MVFKVSDEVKPVAEQFFAGFSYFKRLLLGGDGLSTEFWRAFRNTFLLSFYGLCFGFPMPIILALFFNEIKSNLVRSTCQVLTSRDIRGCRPVKPAWPRESERKEGSLRPCPKASGHWPLGSPSENKDHRHKLSGGVLCV